MPTRYERLVGLRISDDAAYTAYRSAMRPILARYGGGFGLDVRVAEVLLAAGNAQFDRLFTIHFPSRAASDAFFTDEEYVAVRNEHFAPSVAATFVLGAYERSAGD